MKPLLPRTDSYLVPIQIPVASPLYLPSSSASFTSICTQQKRNISRGTKRVRIAPKVKILSCITELLTHPAFSSSVWEAKCEILRLFSAQSHVEMCLEAVVWRTPKSVLQVTQSDIPAVAVSPQNTDLKVEVKEELVCIPIKCETPKVPTKRQASNKKVKNKLFWCFYLTWLLCLSPVGAELRPSLIPRWPLPLQ